MQVRTPRLGRRGEDGPKVAVTRRRNSSRHVVMRAKAEGKSEKKLAQAAQGSGGVPIPGGLQNTCGCGTLGHG